MSGKTSGGLFPRPFSSTFAVFGPADAARCVGRGAHAPSPDDRCGLPGLRSLPVRCASPSWLRLLPEPGSRGMGTPFRDHPDSIKKPEAPATGMRMAGLHASSPRQPIRKPGAPATGMRVAATDAPLAPSKGDPIIRRHARYVPTIERAAAQFLAMAPTGRGSRKPARLLENAVAKAAETAKVEATGRAATGRCGGQSRRGVRGSCRPRARQTRLAAARRLSLPAAHESTA